MNYIKTLKRVNLKYNEKGLMNTLLTPLTCVGVFNFHNSNKIGWITLMDLHYSLSTATTLSSLYARFSLSYTIFLIN